MRPWLTFLVPTFNGRSYLKETLTSIQDQMVRADGEADIFIIDDASTDDTVDVVLRSDFHESQIIINDINIGLYASLNKALSMISSEYTCIIFQDDLLESHYLNRMKRLVIQYPHIDFFWGAVNLIDETGQITERGLTTDREEVIYPGVESWRSALTRGTFWTISGSLSKTQRLRDHGFRPDFPHCADFYFILRALRENIFLYFENPLTKIRIHEKQASAKNLRSGVDIQERTRIYHEQRRIHRDDFSIGLKFTLDRRIITSIFTRILGNLKRGDVINAVKLMNLIKTMKLLLFSLSI